MMMGENQPVMLLVKVLVINEDDELLVLRKSETAPMGAFTWDLPGGIVEYGEDPAQAAMRETREETGIHLDEVLIVGVNAGTAGQYIVKFSYVSQLKSSAVHLSYEHDRYKWIALDEVEALNMPLPYKKDVQRLRKLLWAAANGAPDGFEQQA